jgi:hypothetical protein
MGGARKLTIADGQLYFIDPSTASIKEMLADTGASVAAVPGTEVDPGAKSKFVNDFAIDAGVLYWTPGSGAVLAMALADSTPTTLSDAAGYALAVDTESAFYSVRGAIFAVPVAGGKASKLTDVGASISSLVGHGDSLYFVADADDGSHLFAIEKSGGEAVPLYSSSSGITSLGVDDDYLYWVDDVAGRLYRGTR